MTLTPMIRDTEYIWITLIFVADNLVTRFGLDHRPFLDLVVTLTSDKTANEELILSVFDLVIHHVLTTHEAN